MPHTKMLCTKSLHTIFQSNQEYQKAGHPERTFRRKVSLAAMELVKIIRQHRLGTGWKSVGWKRFRLCSEGKLKKTHWILTLVHKNAETARKMRASSRKWLGSTLCPDRTDNCKLLLHLLCVCVYTNTPVRLRRVSYLLPSLGSQAWWPSCPSVTWSFSPSVPAVFFSLASVDLLFVCNINHDWNYQTRYKIIWNNFKQLQE